MKLKILQLNIDSVYTKINELRILAKTQQPHMIFLNETKLDPGKQAPKIQNYEVILKNRTSRGGGVAIYFMSNIILREVQITSNFETIGVILDDILYIAIYNPGHFTIQETDITDLLEIHPKTLVIGDFNCKNIQWGDSASNNNGKKLAKICEKKNYAVITPDEPTFYQNKRSSILDMALAKNIYPTEIEVLPDMNTAHRPVVFTIGNIHGISLTPKIKRRDYKQANWTKFKKAVSENLTLNREISTTTQIDSTIQEITQTIINAADSHIPWIQEGKTNLPSDLHQLTQERNRARRKFQRNPSQQNEDELNTKKYILEEAIKQYHTDLWNKRIKQDVEKKGNVYTLIRYRKNQTTRLIPGLRDPAGNIHHNPEEKANLLAETLYNHHTMTANFTDPTTRQEVTETIEEFQKQTFTMPEDEQISINEIRRIISATRPYKAPGLDGLQNILLKKLPRKALVQIYYICKACFTCNYFPTTWKEATIIPIKKPGKDSRDPTAYRPISLLSNMGKILERLILNRLKKFDDRIPDTQFGFRHHRTTELQLATLIDEAMTSKIRGKTTAVATLDLEKAYDTLWHHGLIYKLISTAIPGYLIKIIGAFLQERSYQVAVTGALSRKYNIPAGVPQGSTLSPVLFLFYLTDIPENKNTKIRLFADDTAVSAVSIKPEQACHYLQDHLDTLADYYKKWCLKVNATKSNIITFDNRQRIPQADVYYEDQKIPYSSKIKYLGVLLDRKLNFNAHTQEIHRKARQATHFIWPFLKPDSSLDEELKIRLITTYIRPILTYASPVWSSTNINNLQKLEVTENKCLRQVLGYRPIEISNKNLWKKANWLRLCKLIYRRTNNFFTYKIHALPCTEHIGSNIIPDEIRKIKGKTINQLLLDHDLEA